MLDDAIEHIVGIRTLFVFVFFRVETNFVAVGGGAVGIVGISNLRRPRKQRNSILESESLEGLGRTLGRCILGRCTLGRCTLGRCTLGRCTWWYTFDDRCWARRCCQRWHSLQRIVLFDCRRLNIRFLGTHATHVHWVRRWRMRVRGG